MSTTSATRHPLAHLNVPDCYQCGKCTAGCPVAPRMDLMPNQIVHLNQSGPAERAWRAEAIWQCVSCRTCTTRCPKSVDVAGVMDAMRQRAVETAQTAPASQRVVLFQKAFLSNIRRHGRLDELELIGQFKSAVFFKERRLAVLWKDAGLAPQLIKRRKFHVRGENVRDRAVVARIFERCLQAPAAAESEVKHEG